MILTDTNAIHNTKFEHLQFVKMCNFTVSGTQWVDTMVQQHTIVRQFSVSLFSPKPKTRKTKPTAEA